MKKQFIVLLTISTLSLSSCEEDYGSVNPHTEPIVAPKVLTITSFYPESAACGTTVTIFGENFGESVSDNNVTFNGAYAEVTQVQRGIVVVRVPLNLAKGDYTISLSAQGQTSTSTKKFNVNG